MTGPGHAVQVIRSVDSYPLQITAQGRQHIESNGIDVDALEIVPPRVD